ncbi:hypothetical protein [Nocardiopsis lambiniae]|uniref:Uncharacterized protein n=1 Tax=Nocardiopsis lambiniae TaxID=3075539 RepID=A0ABU2MC83_9ACTN|nr:hypothetical protein [Nocardiopsis sp. DSM 44743]MDT0330175.1 hypothetical protein [Nocardiopsis sp. DSM 44743]
MAPSIAAPTGRRESLNALPAGRAPLYGEAMFGFFGVTDRAPARSARAHVLEFRPRRSGPGR